MNQAGVSLKNRTQENETTMFRSRVVFVVGGATFVFYLEKAVIQYVNVTLIRYFYKAK